MTTRESILTAISAALATTGATVIRNADVPATVPLVGLIILRDGEPGEPEVSLSPLSYSFDHRVDVEIYCQASAKTARATTLDALLTDIGDALATDRTFGGLADFSIPGAPVVTDTGATGAQSIASATFTLTVQYTVNDPLKG